jgi:hypothetical protein
MKVLAGLTFGFPFGRRILRAALSAMDDRL